MAGHLLGDLAGKVAIVTGSSAGIGKATAEYLAKLGCQVTICGRNKTGLEETRQSCIAAGLKSKQVLALPGELMDVKHLEELASATRKHFGKLDVLINNAGAATFKTFEDSTMKEFDNMISVNLRSTVALTQLCLPDLIKSKGNVIIVSSIVALITAPILFHYSIAKAGLNQFAKNLTMEVAKDGVRVNLVSPGIVMTSVARDEGGKALWETGYEKTVSAIPLRMPGQPIDIAKLIAYLASDDARYVTGSNFVIDGGSTAKGGLDSGELGI